LCNHWLFWRVVRRSVMQICIVPGGTRSKIVVVEISGPHSSKYEDDCLGDVVLCSLAEVDVSVQHSRRRTSSCSGYLYREILLVPRCTFKELTEHISFHGSHYLSWIPKMKSPWVSDGVIWVAKECSRHDIFIFLRMFGLGIAVR
jgi:hypothetical protein